MPACLAGQPSPQGLTFMLTLHGGRGSLSIRKAENFRPGGLLSFLSEIVAWSP